MNETTKKARQLFQQGQTDKAYELLMNNHEVESQALLRETYLGENQVELAIPLMDQLSGSDSTESLVSSSMASFLKQDFESAITWAQQAIQSDESSVHAYNHLGRALQNSGQPLKACKAFKAALKKEPTYPQAWHNLAHTRRAMGALDEAVQYYRKAIDLFPDYQSAWFNLGVTLAAMEQHEEALKSFEQLLSINETHTLAWLNKGLANHALGQFDRAIESYDNTMDIDPNLALAFTYKGILLNELQESSQALKCLEHALKLDPNEIDAWCELTDVHEKLNDIDSAKKANEKARALAPHHPTVLIDAARLEKRQNNAKQALVHLNQITPEQLPYRKAVEYWYELGDVLDKNAEYDQAFQAFKKGNHLASQSPRHQSHDPDALSKRIANIQSNLDVLKKPQNGGFLSKIFKSKAQQPSDPSLGKNHCFLIGFPRSGTTLMDTILSAHEDIVSIEEKPTIEKVVNHIKSQGKNHCSEADKSQLDWEGLRQMYFDQVKSYLPNEAPIDDSSVVIDKLPFRFLEASFIHELLPDARFIFMQRHPKDVILSNFMQNYAPNETFIHFNDLASSVKVYDETMNLWNRIQEHLGDRLLVVKYEDLVIDSEKVTKKVCHFLGVNYQAEMLDTQSRLASRGRISTNSYAQVAMDIHQKSNNRHRHYNQFFNEHEALLKQHLDKNGY